MSRYTVYVTPAAWKEIKQLPGHLRHRVRRAVTALGDDPRPARSKALDISAISCEARRLRIDRWRILYTITEAEKLVDVLAIRKRPPYDYGDLDALLGDYPSA